MLGGGERRVVSALISDIADSTSISERLGPERSKFLFDEIARLTREEIERFGGTVAQLTGDGVLALFGAPMAHEDDATRAVRAAVALQASLRRYGAEIGPAYGIEIVARVAVNTGPVVVPDLDAPVDALYNALGDTVNVAARLQSLGDLIVGPATARLVEDSFEVDDLGEIELKGISQPVRAFRVIGPREGRPLSREGSFVGRAHDIAVLQVVFGELTQGTGSIVSLTGEPGIGKSRLIAEMSDRLAGSVRFVAGHALTDTETIPYWPLRDLLRAWLGLGLSEPEARVRLELRAALARTLGREAEEAFPVVASMMGLVSDSEHEERLRGFAPDAVQRQAIDWLYQLVVAMAAERPTCLMIEDVQWCDEATLAVLDELLPASEHAPVVFLLIHRNDPDHRAWPLVDRARRRFKKLFVDLELEPLDEDEVHALAVADAGGELPEELTHLLAERAGGNPYFVGEAIRDLRERGVLGADGGAHSVPSDTQLPTALQGALQARIDRLDGQARELISVAAVIGASFSLPLLERLLPRMRVLPILSQLQWLQLLVEERALPTPEYRFRHGLVKEVAYGALVEPRRRELHLLVGEALLAQYRDTPAEAYGVLARHFAEADEPARAIEYLLKAGDAARAIYAEQEAIGLYRRALSFRERTGDDGRARATLLKIALTHHLAFDFRAASDALGEAFALPEPAPDHLDPTERIEWALPVAWDGAVAPGHSYSLPGFEVMRNLYRGLVFLGQDLDIEPDLAEDISITDDGLVYRFRLRPDAFWSDGVPVTAADFEFTFARTVEEGLATASWLDGVEAVAINERNLEVRLGATRNDFLYALSQPPLWPWPRHVYERDGPEWHRASSLVGNGPFVLVERDPDRLVLVTAPQSYWPRGNVREVVIDTVASPAEAADRWRRGRYDVLNDSIAGQMEVDEQTAVDRSPGLLTSYVGFNSTRPPFDDARLRRAAAHALDRTVLAEAFNHQPAGTGGVIPPAVPGHSQRVAPAHDLARARALLAEAGHPQGHGLDEIVLACLDLWQEAAVSVAKQLAAIGISARPMVVASDRDMDAAASLHADAFLWVWGGDYPDTGRGFLGPLLEEYSLYRDDRLRQLLTRAKSLRDKEERLRIYREFDRIWIGEQAAMVPIGYGEMSQWRRPWITGMWASSTEVSTFAEAVVKRPNP